MAAHRVKVTCPHGFVVETAREVVGKVLYDLCCACAYENRPRREMSDRIKAFKDAS